MQEPGFLFGKPYFVYQDRHICHHGVIIVRAPVTTNGSFYVALASHASVRPVQE